MRRIAMLAEIETATRNFTPLFMSIFVTSGSSNPRIQIKAKQALTVGPSGPYL